MTVSGDGNEGLSATVQSTKTRHNEGMNLEAFKASTKNDKPPRELSTSLEAMWYQGKGDWKEAHRLAQSQNNPNVSWVHAHLHRVEGDLRNPLLCNAASLSHRR
jgi:hypothetical protein